MDEDRSHWPTKAEAATSLQLTERSLELKVRAGEIRADRRPRARKKPEVILHPADIESLKHKPITPKPTPKGEIAKRIPSELVSSTKAKTKDERQSAIRNFRDALQSGAIPLPFHEIGWLSLADAARYSGIPKDIIKNAIAKDKLSAFTRGNRYWIKWSELKTFVPHGEMPKTKLTANFRNGITSQSRQLLEAL